jgi:hypothetical protein
MKELAVQRARQERRSLANYIELLIEAEAKAHDLKVKN